MSDKKKIEEYERRPPLVVPDVIYKYILLYALLPSYSLYENIETFQEFQERERERERNV